MKIDNFRFNSKHKNFPRNIFPLLISNEKWPFEDNSINCIINNLYFHSVESYEDLLRKYNKSLIPDGCLFGNFFTENSFQELKAVMNIAESEREGGLSPNGISFTHISDFGNTLGRLNYTLPSIQMNKYKFLFSDLSEIFVFLKIIGETNFLTNRRMYKRRDTYIAAMAIYQSLFNNTRESEDPMLDTRIINVDLRNKKGSLKDDYIFLTVEIASFISWKYHYTQPKPKERGSAEIHLKDIATDLFENESDPTLKIGSINQIGDTDEFEIVEITEKIKERIRKKLGDEVLEEKLKNVNDKNIK